MRGVFVLFLIFVSLRGCAEKDYYVAFSMGAAKKTVDASSYLANQNGAFAGRVMVPFSPTASTKITHSYGSIEARLGVPFIKTETFVTHLEVTYEHDPVQSQKTIGYEAYFDAAAPGAPAILMQQSMEVNIKAAHWIGVAFQVQFPVTEKLSLLGRIGVKRGNLSYASSLAQSGVGFLGHTRVRKTVYGFELEGGGLYQLGAGLHALGSFGYFFVPQNRLQYLHPQAAIDYQPRYKQRVWKGKIGILYAF